MKWLFFFSFFYEGAFGMLLVNQFLLTKFFSPGV